MKECLYATGFSPSFFSSAKLESLDGLKGASLDKAQVRNVVRLLMCDVTSGWLSSINFRSLKTALINADAKQKQYLFDALQEGLETLMVQLSESPLNELQHRQAHLYISQVLSFVPFAYPESGAKLSVPQWTGSKWQQAEYEVERIELTSSQPDIPFIYTDDDRVYAYGLNPCSHMPKSVEPWLLFHGTTYPGGGGLTTQLMTDLKPFRTVGHDLFVMGLPNIKRWFDKFPQQKMRLTGVSLGGSLTLLAVSYFTTRCREGIAFNPAGLVENDAFAELNRWESGADNPNVLVVKQGDDLVHSCGTWLPDWTILTAKVSESLPSAVHHFVNFAGLKSAVYTSELGEDDNAKRGWSDFLLYTVARTLAYSCLALPWRYVLVPAWRMISWAVQACFSFVVTLASSLVAGCLTGMEMVIQSMKDFSCWFIAGTTNLYSACFSEASEYNEVEGQAFKGDV